jgi:hypothetical protein
MTALRDELHHLVDGLPEDQVPVALALVRRLAPDETADDWPPPWFGAITSDRDDTAATAKDTLRAEYGQRRPA